MSVKEELEKVETKSKRPGVLGTLKGICADFINPTRNGRKYPERLWENVFNNEIVNEYFENGGIFGELSHPTDRTETLPEKIAICMPSKPVKNKDGQLEATFDILDTPNGRILKTLVDYGYKIGISSRGTGDVYEDENGEEVVDENTYDFQGFDAVLLPAVKAARMNPVNESLGSKTLKQALCESLSNATEEERKVMEETLDTLNIDYKQQTVVDNKLEESVKSDEVVEETSEAVDNGANEVIKDLQEALISKSNLEAQVAELQNKVAVGDTEVSKLNEEVNTLQLQLSKYKTAVVRLSEGAKKVKELEETVSKLEESLELKTKIIKRQRLSISELRESKTANTENSEVLTESMNKKDNEIKKLNEELSSMKVENDAKIKELTESLEHLKADSELNHKEYAKNLNSQKKLAEKYSNIAGNTVNRYISLRANMLGIRPEEIKNKLGEQYTLDDIDSICEELRTQTVNMSRLPITLDRKVKVRVTESKNEVVKQHNSDDVVDSSLLKIAGLK